MNFANSGYLFLLLLLIPYIIWYLFKGRRSEPTMQMSDTYAYRNAPKSNRVRFIHLPMFLRCVTYVLVIIILARPQSNSAWNNKETEGIDTVSYTHLTLPTIALLCRSRWSPYH